MTPEWEGTLASRQVGGSSTSSVSWAFLLMLVAAAFAVAVPLWQDPAFFFSDDVKHQHLPVMMEIGRRLREGRFPAVTDLSGFGGNLLGEYQYGLLNPFSLLIYLALPSFSSLGSAAAFLAATHYLILATGLFVLMLELGARPCAAALAAVMMVTNVFLAYWLASAWLPGLVATAWLPWALAMLRKARRSSRWIPAGAAAVYLVDASGWPHAVIALAIMASALFLLERRTDAQSVHGGWFALVAGFVASVPVWIPLAAFARMADRTNGMDDLKELFVPPLNALLDAGFPTERFMMKGLDGWERVGVPFLFAGVAVLIVPALVQPDWWRRHFRQLACWLVVAAIFVLLAMGPSQVGPLRWPLRYVPYLHLVLCILAALLVSHAPLDSTARGLGRALAACGLAFVIAWQQTTDGISTHLAALALLAAATYGTWRLAGRPEAVSLLLIAVTLLTWGGILTRYPSNTDLNAWQVPAKTDGYRLPPMVARDDVVFTPLKSGSSLRGGAEHGIYSGDMGMLSGMKSWNGYSPMRPAALADDLCMDQFGWTCRGVLSRLTTIDPATHLSRMQLMGITRLVLDRKHGWWPEPVDIPGASLCHLDEFVMVYCVPRTHEYPVTWSSAPMSFAVIDARGTSIRLAVTNAAPGTEVSFARAWYPGFTARLDGKLVPSRMSRYGLVRVRLPATRRGVLELHWGYPGLAAAWAAAIAALLITGLGIRRCRSGAQRSLVHG